jgi:hypothetical protein
MTVKKYLADIYGYRPGYLFNQLSQEKLDAKVRFCKEFISTIGLVDPGYTKVIYFHCNSYHRPPSSMYVANKILFSASLLTTAAVRVQ